MPDFRKLSSRAAFFYVAIHHRHVPQERHGVGGGIGRFPSYVIPGYLLKDRTVIGRHIRNAIQEGEIDPKVVCAKFARMGGFY